jgi:hypothetical protein
VETSDKAPSVETHRLFEDQRRRSYMSKRREAQNRYSVFRLRNTQGSSRNEDSVFDFGKTRIEFYVWENTMDGFGKKSAATSKLFSKIFLCFLIHAITLQARSKVAAKALVRNCFNIQGVQ